MCLESTRKTVSTDVWKRAVTTCGKSYTLLSAQEWQHMEHLPLFIKCAVKTCRKPNPLLFERGHWQHVENHIHCLMKQQWQHMEIHPLLTKCVLKAQEKLHPLIFEREQWQQVENPIHCLVHFSDKMENHPLLFERGQWQHAENNIQYSLNENSGNLWKITSTA